MTSITDLAFHAQELLRTNQFASGGLLVAATAGAVAAARKMPGRLYAWLWRRRFEPSMFPVDFEGCDWACERRGPRSWWIQSLDPAREPAHLSRLLLHSRRGCAGVGQEVQGAPW